MLLPDCRERHSVVEEKEDERQRAYRIKRPGKRVTGNWWSDKWLDKWLEQGFIATDLGTLPGPAGLSSAATWISDNGLIAGFSENKQWILSLASSPFMVLFGNREELLDVGTFKGGCESISVCPGRRKNCSCRCQPGIL